MSDSIIEQVKRLAVLQTPLMTNFRGPQDGPPWELWHTGGPGGCIATFVAPAAAEDVAMLCNAVPALLAHIATQAEALKVAVEALEKYSDPHKYEDRGMGILVAPDDATAALSRIAALTGEKK